MGKTDKTIPLLLVAFLLLLAAGPLLPSWFVYLTAISLSKALVVVGLVVLKRAGLVSFGQGLYYCLGGYTVGIAGSYWGISDAFVLIALNIFNQLVHLLEHSFIRLLPIKVVFPCPIREHFLHSTNSLSVPLPALSCSMDSINRLAFFGLRSK